VVSVPDKNDKAIVHQVKVLQIRRQSVLLEAAGRAFTVELTPPTLGQGDDIIRSGTP
jgi:hypothetical protein